MVLIVFQHALVQLLVCFAVADVSMEVWINHSQCSVCCFVCRSPTEIVSCRYVCEWAACGEQNQTSAMYVWRAPLSCELHASNMCWLMLPRVSNAFAVEITAATLSNWKSRKHTRMPQQVCKWIRPMDFVNRIGETCAMTLVLIVFCEVCACRI